MAKTWVLETDLLRLPDDAAILGASDNIISKSLFAHFTGSPNRGFFDYVVSCTAQEASATADLETSARLIVAKEDLEILVEEVRRLNTAFCKCRVIDRSGALCLLEVQLTLKRSQSPLSVVVPSFNPRIEELKRCLDSILKAIDQTITKDECEILLVDDCSTNSDQIQELLKESYASEKRINYRRQPENKGVASARNRGFAEARHPLVFFVDHDDRIEPMHLNLGVQEILVNGADIAASSMRFPDGHIFCAHLSEHRGVLLENVFGSGIVIDKRSPNVAALLKTGELYNSKLVSHFEDWELNCVAKLLGWRISVTPYPSYFYHFAPNGRDSTNLSLKRRAWLMTGLHAIERVKAISTESAFNYLHEYTQVMIEQILDSERAWKAERERLIDEAVSAHRRLNPFARYPSAPKLNIIASLKVFIYRFEARLAQRRLLNQIYRLTIAPIMYGSYRLVRTLYRRCSGGLHA